MTNSEGVRLICRLREAFVATSWRNKCDKVCNGTKYGVTLHQI